MHTTVIADDETGQAYTFLHNGDYSGSVHIVLPNPRAVFTDHDGSVDLLIPVHVLCEFIGQMVQSTTIGALEQLSGRQYLIEHNSRRAVG